MSTSKTNEQKKSKDFFDRVYLCTQEIGKIKCKKFKSFEEANSYHISTYKNKKTEETNLIFPVYEVLSTMIPICKYTPKFLDKPILKFKLFNMMYVKLN